MNATTKKALEQSYRTYKNQIYGFLYELLSSKLDAQEVTQETFLALFHEFEKNEIPFDNQRKWLFRVAKNKGLNVLRHRKYVEQTPSSEERVSKTPEQATVAKENHEQMKDRVQYVMSLLSKRESMVLRLYMNELNYNEIADVLDISKSSVSKTLGRAKRAFKNAYENEYHEIFE